ncbi:MAG: hypothetical protein FJW38_13195 [Acidobacteria bacterium]|nr:hypothetical protein [Acidobacteriota bacterium]
MVQEFCDKRGWQFCIIGGLAVQRWAEPRVTRDVDMTLLTGFGHEDLFIEALSAAFPPRIADHANFAKTTRVLLLGSPDNVGTDIAMGALPFEESAVSRASRFRFNSGVEIRTCSAEDLIVMKLFAHRHQDIRDVETTVYRQHQKLDWKYIEEQLRPLVELKEEPEILRTLERVRKL